MSTDICAHLCIIKNHMQKQNGLYCTNLNRDWKLILDPDCVFWELIPREKPLRATWEKRGKALYEGLRERLNNEMRDFRFSAKLTAVYINPIDACPANCPYCYIPNEIRKSGRRLNPKELDLILNKVDEYFTGEGLEDDRKPVIVFHASEPLLVKGMLFRAIEENSGRFRFGIQTNAALLEDEDIEFIKRNKVSIGISLDSIDPKINERLRTTSKATFDKIISAIASFKGYKGLNVISTVTKSNVRELPGLVEFLHRKEVSAVLFNPVRLTQMAARRLRPSQDEMFIYFKKAIERAIELSKNSRRHIIIANFANLILGIIAPQARRLMCDISPCGGGRCFLTILASGDIIPCGEFVGLPRFKGGNIFKNSIQEAMRSAPFIRLRARRVERIRTCDACAFRNICGSPCPAEVYSFKGRLNEISPYCRFYKRLIKYAFELIAEGEVGYLLREEGMEAMEYEYKL